MESISSGNYRRGKESFDSQALRFTFVLSASILLMSTESSWSQCAPATGQLTLNGSSCSETGVTRTLDLPSTTAPLIDVINGGEYSGTSVSLSNSTGHDGHGLSVVGVGSIAHLFDSAIITTGSGYGYGVNIADGGSFIAKDLEVTTTADNSDAISMRGPGSTAVLDGASLETAGKTAEGIQAENGASFTGTGVEIITLAEGADAYANGVLLWNGATGQLTNSSITTAGRLSAGIWAISSSNFSGTRLDINTSGPESEGVFVDGGSSVILVESSVTTSGANAAGTSVDGAGSSVEFNRGTINASGQNADAVVVNNGGSQILTDVAARASGDGGSAILVENTLGTDRGQVTVNGGSLSSVAGSLIRADAGHGQITLNGPVVVSPGISGGRTVLADVFNGSDLDLTFNSVSGVTGDVDVSGADTALDASFGRSDWTGNLLVSGGLADLSLVASTWTGRSAGATSIAVDNASEWNVTASSNAGSISNAGLISFVSGDTSSVLSAGSYDAQNGFLAINTVLGADDSATNRLIIDGGSATGTTGLIVRNAGGAGDLTTADGIRIVETQGGAATDTDAFYLTSRTAVGGYEYLLFRGGTTSTEDWFLRSHIIAPEVPEEPEVPEVSRGA